MKNYIFRIRNFISYILKRTRKISSTPEFLDEPSDTWALGREILLVKPYFDQQYYLSNDLTLEGDADSLIRHYLTIGWRKGVNPSSKFSNQFYLLSHPDVRRAQVPPLLHYAKDGFRERRNFRAYPCIAWPSCLTPSTYKSKQSIAVIVHIYYADMLGYLLPRLANLPEHCHIFATCPASLAAEVDERMAELNYEFSVMSYPNNGYDILPFLLSLPIIKAKNFDLICKIHTKKGNAGVDTSADLGQEYIWSDLCLDPIMGTKQIVDDILFAFEQDESIGMIGSADMYKSAKHLDYGNRRYVTSAIRELAPSLDACQDFGFFAGSMFWCRLAVLEPLLSLDLPQFVQKAENHQALTGLTASPWHALERVLGRLPSMVKCRTVLSFAANLQRSEFCLQLDAKASLLTAPKFTRIRTTLMIERDIKQIADRIKSCPGAFDDAWYLAHIPHHIDNLNETINHYLRYGFHAGVDPSPNFSSYAYCSAHLDIVDNNQEPLNHYIRFGKAEGRPVFPSIVNYLEIEALIRESELFDLDYYRGENLNMQYDEALSNFVKAGWKDGKNPNQNFDVVWYQQRYMASAFLKNVNPLAHYIRYGKNLGYETRPVYKSNLEAIKYEPQYMPRRACLFAAYDRDGIVDQYLVDYVSELSRHSDVFVLFDCDVAAQELAKLSGFAKSVWAARHGEYDFGSYSRLAGTYVGWDILEQYDELLFVNDSCYPIRKLDHIFEEMDKRECDWWGLQATKGISATKEAAANQFSTKIPMEEVTSNLLSEFERDQTYDFHVGSYFLAFRKRVLSHSGFKALIDNVCVQSNKKNIILFYEIGLTRYLLTEGFKLDTFISHLYPFHPVFTEHYFELVRRGFPLLKRFFLTENHYLVPDLHNWEGRLKKIIPELDTAAINQNLYRVADYGKLQFNLNIPSGDASDYMPLTPKEFAHLDANTENRPDWWVFTVSAYGHTFSGNERAVFEQVRYDPTIKKIILYRSLEIHDVDGENIELAPLSSRRGQELLLNSRVIIIGHAPSGNIVHPVNEKRHLIVNLWHGIPLKQIGNASLDRTPGMLAQHRKCSLVIASSKIDRLAMTAAFYPLEINDIHITGLPRIDFILGKPEDLPLSHRNTLELLDRKLQGRNLIMFAPTFRNGAELAYYNFTNDEIAALQQVLSDNNAVLGVREHMADRAHSYSAKMQGNCFLDLGMREFPDIEPLLRVAKALVTDYSSCYIDYLVTDRPVISFAYDHERYGQAERGLFYDMDMVFPGPVCHSFEALLSALEQALKEGVGAYREKHMAAKQIFFSYSDCENSFRVVDLIKMKSNEFYKPDPLDQIRVDAPLISYPHNPKVSSVI